MNKISFVITSCLVIMVLGMLAVANTINKNDRLPEAIAQTVGEDGPEKTTSAGPVVIDFVGDSIGVGTVSLSRVRQSLVGRMVTREPNWFIRNFSTGAATVSIDSGMAHSINPASLFTFWPKNVVILLGVNDYNASASSSIFEQKYTTFVTSLKNSSLQTKVICVTPVWKAGEENKNLQGLSLEDYRVIIRNVCNAANAPIVEGKDMIPNKNNYYVDGLHPNSQGYMHYARNLSRALELYFPN